MKTILTLTTKSLLLALCLLLTCNYLQAQVTVGSGDPAKSFSVLELSTKNVQGGLRLPHLTTAERDILTASQDFLDNRDNLAKGLIIFNTTNNCIESWNGTKWLSVCDGVEKTGGVIGTLTCGTNTITTTNGQSITSGNTFTIPYSGKTGSDIVLTNAQTLGTTNGLSVVADGAQTLIAASGSVKIKVTGTCAATGSFALNYTVGGTSCSIAMVLTEITGYNCGGVTGTTSASMASLSAVNLNTLVLPYTKTGGNISLTGNTSLGSAVNGLTASVRGTQTLTAASGNLNIQITGTPTAFGTFNIPVTVKGTTCNIPVTISQSGGAIGTLTCGNNTINVVSGTAVTSDNTFSIPYSSKTGANIVLTNNQVLGTATNGLSVLVNNAQTLTAVSGTISVKVTGTCTATAGFNLNYTVGGANCTIGVVISEITSYDCSGVTGTTSASMASLSAVNLSTLVLPYTKTGGDIALANNTALGTAVNGLTAQVRNAQTLTAASGNLNIKITGTPTAFGTFNIPVTVKGTTCTIPVTITQTGGAIGTLTCGSNTINVTNGTAVSTGNTFSIAYSGKTGADITLANNQSLGTATNGLSVLVNNAQTLSAASGTVNVKVTGTPSATTAFNLNYTVGGASCTIGVVLSEITSYNCSGVTGTTSVSMASLSAVTLNTLVLPYTKTGGNVSLTANATLGSAVNGLTASVRGSQTLTAASGNMNIQITGTPTAFGTFNIPVTVKGTTCTIPVTITQSAGAIGALTCGSNTVSIVSGQAVSTGNTFSIPYSGRTGANITLANNQSLGTTSNGLSVQANGAQTLSSATGNILVKVTGTCTATSNFTLNYSVGGQSCTIGVTVLPSLAFTSTYNVNPGTTVLNVNGAFTNGTGDAKTRGTGTNHASMSAGVFRYTGGNGAAFAAVATTVSGITVTVPATTLANGAGELAVNVSGTPASTVQGKAFDIPITVLGQQLYVRVSVGCGAYTSATRTVPSTGGDPAWKQFQCFNLGADTNLDPFTYVEGNAAGTTGTLGALYQWGRRTDGHQNRNSATTTTLATSNTPNNANFILGTEDQNYNWRNADITTLWGNGSQSENPAKGTNDPCPTGWKVPSSSQWTSILIVGAASNVAATSATSNVWAYSQGYKVGTALFLPSASWRMLTGQIDINPIRAARYWSSTTNLVAGEYSDVIAWGNSGLINVPGYNAFRRAGGLSVRCVAE